MVKAILPVGSDQENETGNNFIGREVSLHEEVVRMVGRVTAHMQPDNLNVTVTGENVLSRHGNGSIPCRDGHIGLGLGRFPGYEKTEVTLGAIQQGNLLYLYILCEAGSQYLKRPETIQSEHSDASYGDNEIFTGFKVTLCPNSESPIQVLGYDILGSEIEVQGLSEKYKFFLAYALAKGCDAVFQNQDRIVPANI